MNGITGSTTILVRILLGILIAVTLLAGPLQAAESGDAQLFVAGFNAYQKEEYGVAVQKLSKMLKEYPTSPLRDMNLFWLARASYRTGDRPEAARTMSRFLKEYPDHPLKGTVEDDLLKLAAQYDQGYTIATAPAPVTSRQPKATTSQLLEKPAPAPQPSVEKIAIPARPVEVTPAESKTVVTKVIPPTEKIVVAKTEPSASPPAASTVPRAEQPVPLPPQLSTVVEATPSDNTSIKQHPVKKSRRSRQREQKEALRIKAIAEYRATMERFPGTTAAVEASERLRKLGETTLNPAPTTKSVSAAPVRSTSTGIAITREAGTSQVVTLEIEQFADLGLTMTLPVIHPEAGSQLSIPFEVTNKGNGTDSFSLESGFPADCSPHFATAADPDVPLSATPNLAPGETWRGVLRMAIPAGNFDGQKHRYPVRASTRFSRTVSRTSELLLTVSAPLLRGLMKPDPVSVLPGETVSYRITLLNIGSAPARSVRFRIEYPAPLDPVAPAGFRQESGSLVMDNFSLKSGESRELTVTFRLNASTPAHQDLICRGELVNPALQTRETFISTAAFVQPVYSVTLTALRDRLVSLPGQTVTVPLTVTNTGNVREPVIVATDAPAGFNAIIFDDSNRNGVRDPGEPVLKQTAALAPKEAVHLILEISVPADAGDGSEATIALTAAPSSGAAGKAQANLRVTVARPRVELTVSGGAGRLKPGEVASLEVVCHNRGSAIARSVAIRSILPSQLELVATEPTAVATPGGELTWSIPELGSGEKRTMRLIYRVKPGITAGATLAVTNRVTYEDHLGNRY